MNELQMNLEAAQATHAEALAKVAKLEERRAAAEAEHAEAVAGRQRLVANVKQGFEVHSKVLASATATIAAAKETLNLWADAKGEAVADAAAAEAPVKAAQRGIALARFAQVIRDRIKAADRLMQIGREFGAAYDAWAATTSELHATWTPDCPAPVGAIQYIDNRQGAYAVTKKIQDIIVSTGSSVEIDLGQRERAAWGRYAVPDSAAETTPAAA